jgi:NADH:ubiquinone oxidoreductase subunit C
MHALYQRLSSLFPLGTLTEQRPDLSFVDVPRAHLIPALLTHLRDREGYSHLVLLTAVDWLEEGEFQLTYLICNRAVPHDLGLRVRIPRDPASMDSIHGLWPTAATYQRELREMFGIDFPGSPRRRRRLHPRGLGCRTALPARFRHPGIQPRHLPRTRGPSDPRPGGTHETTAVSGRRRAMNLFAPDRSQYPSKMPDGTLDIDLASGKYLKLWHGPNHPGITGNMSVEITLCGDEVVEGKTHVGYLHRGFEKLMERRTFIQCFPIVCRICVPEPDFNEYCYAAAVEELAGLEIPEKARWMRALILEMGRINSYLMYLGGQAGALGQGVIGQWTTYARDLMLDRFEELTGARIYHMFILPGGVRDDLPEGFGARMAETLAEIESTLEGCRKGHVPQRRVQEAHGRRGRHRPGLARPLRRHRPQCPRRRRRPGRAQGSPLSGLSRSSISRSPSATTRTSTRAPTCVAAMS